MSMSTPIFALNYKTYNTSIGDKAVEIARTVERLSIEYNVQGIVAVPLTMIHRVASSTRGEVLVLAQHVDPISPGRGTGYSTVEMIEEAGAKGSILNHSEHPLSLPDLSLAVKKLSEKGLVSLVCADTPQAAQAVAAFSPSIIAVEPPELIGTGISVTRARPEVVTESIGVLRSKAGYPGPILVGAGVSTRDDVAKSLELGAQGVLLASAVMKAPDPVTKLEELYGAFSKKPRLRWF